MRYFLLLITLLFAFEANSQTLVASYPFPDQNVFDGFWGITEINDTLYIGSDYTGNIYKVTKTGNIVDTINVTSTIDFNHGLAWDGSGFWIAEDFRTAGARIYKVNMAGNIVDSIYTGTYAGGIGDIVRQGNALWFTVYSPDFTSYPNAFAYKVDLTTKLLVDTIPLRGRQVNGIAIKGDTILYANELFHTTPTIDPERIYAYRDAVGDTLFSFPGPDPDGDDNPKGIHWDGQHLYVLAERIGGTAFVYKTLYKYSITGQGNPVIFTSANTITFPNTLIGSSSNQPLSITNNGTAKLIISNFSSNNPRFTITPNNVPDTLNPAQTKNYTVTFSPLAFGNDSANLTIVSNDGAVPNKIVKLYGKGVYTGSFVHVSQTSFNYQSRRMFSQSGFIFELTNQGNQPLNITSMTTGTQRFRIDTAGVTFPFQLDTQRTKLFRVWFNPTNNVTYNDTLTIQSNAVNPSVKIALTGTGSAPNSVLGTILWTAITPDNPNTTSDDFQPKTIMRINDVNYDGINDVVVASENYWIVCWNGNASVNGDTLWKFNTHFGTNNTGSVDYVNALQTIDDVDGDNIRDVVFGCGGGNEMVYCLSGRTGKKIWEYGDPVNNDEGDIYAIRTDKDWNNDGKPDVLISASGAGDGDPRHAAICVNGINGQVIFNTIQNSHFTYDIVNTNSGGAIGYGSNGGPYGVYGFNNSGQTTWNYNIPGTLNAVWSMRMVPDVNANSSQDIVGFNGFSGSVFGLDGNSGTQLWQVNLGNSNDGKIVVTTDLNNNGSPDFVLAGPQSANRVDSKTGAILWTIPLGYSYIRDVDIISDYNNDGTPEVAFITQQPSKIVILSGANGTNLHEYTFGTTLNERGDRLSYMESVDPGSFKDIVGGARDGKLVCIAGGPSFPISINPISSEIPEAFSLYQNYPNPFNPVTIIKFDLPKASLVKIIVYDALGRQVTELINEQLSAGVYETEFNGSALSSGVYFYKMVTAGFSDIKKLMLIK